MLNNILDFFRDIGIRNKLLIGYIPLVGLTILLSGFTVLNIERLNKINREIIDIYIPAIEITENLMENFLAEEQYGLRFRLLKSEEIHILFDRRRSEVDALLLKLRELSDPRDAQPGQLINLHREYISLFEDVTLSGDSLRESVKKKQGELLEQTRKMASRARKTQNSKAVRSSELGALTFQITVPLCILSFILVILSTVAITQNISHSINKLMDAVKRISEGKFDTINEHARNRDELSRLYNAFADMAKRLKLLESFSLDANPLTRLPGGLAIENELEKRISEGKEFAFCLIDIDNFKAFGDHYGYARGSDVIKFTARIIEDTLTRPDLKGGFVGHIGGDDFVTISSLDRYESACNQIIRNFDRLIPSFYDMEDSNRGYIAGIDRQGNPMNFPIMTLSIAAVTGGNNKLIDAIQFGEKAAELKACAKMLLGSNLVKDTQLEKAMDGIKGRE